MIDENEKLFRETIKNVLKMGILNNNRLTPIQKQNALNRVDDAAEGADLIDGILRMCGYQ